jgi:hypothetical protein
MGCNARKTTTNNGRLWGRNWILHEQRIILFSMENKMKIIYLFIGNEIWHLECEEPI